MAYPGAEAEGLPEVKEPALRAPRALPAPLLPAQGSSPGSIGLSLPLEKSPYMDSMGYVTEPSRAKPPQGEP